MPEHLKPSFFIIGERKCGTSSLYRYLIAHPNVLPCREKEPQFFSRNLWHIWWKRKEYFSLFPPVEPQGETQLNWLELDQEGNLVPETVTIEQKPGVHYLTGEASANTFFLANPRVVRHFLPGIKLILMLRNPIDRTFSHFRMLRRFWAEGRKGPELADFGTQMQREMHLVRTGRKSNLLSPSLYVLQLSKWLKVFGRGRLFIIRTEDMENASAARKVMSDLCRYLELPAFDFSGLLGRRFNQSLREDLAWEIRQELTGFFLPYNQALEDMIGRKMDWNHTV